MERFREAEKLRPVPPPMQFPHVPFIPKWIPNSNYPFGEPILCKAAATYGSP